MAIVPHNLETIKSHKGCRITRQPASVQATFDSDPAHLSAVRMAIESLCADAGFDAKAVGEIGLVVNEAIANIIRHAYGSARDKPIEAHAELKGDAVEIRLRDWGKGQMPVPPAKRAPPDPLTPGGLGLVCMHSLMNQVVFTPQPDGMLLTMHRKKAK